MVWYLHIDVNQQTKSNRPWLNYRQDSLNAQMSVQFPSTQYQGSRNDTHTHTHDTHTNKLIDCLSV